MSREDLKCNICDQPLLTDSDTWTDDAKYGDVHQRCFEAKEGGFNSVEDMDTE